MKVKKNIELDCGCCGSYFRTWEGYQDQDQDRGYGICERCQESIQADDDKQVDKILNLLRANLNAENLVRINALTRDQQRRVAYQAIEEGMVSFSFGRVA